MILFRAEKWNKEDKVTGYYVHDCETKQHRISLQEVENGVIIGYQIKHETLEVKIGDADWIRLNNLNKLFTNKQPKKNIKPKCNKCIRKGCEFAEWWYCVSCKKNKYYHFKENTK